MENQTGLMKAVMKAVPVMFIAAIFIAVFA